MRSLRQLLVDSEPALLRVIASRWDIPIDASTRPRDIAGAIAAGLSRADHALGIVERLTPPEREALRALIANGGSMGASGFAQRFGSIRPIGPARLERDQPWRAPVSPAEGLWYLGLIYRAFEQRPGGMQEVIVAPVELHALRPLLAAQDLPAEALPPVAAPERPTCAGAMLADDLCTLLAHLLNPRDRAWTRQLRDPDPDRLVFLSHFAQRARLVQPDQRRLDPAPALAWLGAPTLDQLRGLFSAWSDDGAWNDLQHVPGLKLEATGQWSNDPVAARRAILRHLRAALPETWHPIDALVAHIKQQSPDFARSDLDTGYIRDAASGDYLRGFAAWDRVEGALIKSVLHRPLLWLGVVDVGRDVFRITPVGAVLLGRSDARLSEPAAKYTVQSDATIVVSASRRYDRFQIARVADFVSAGDVYVYRLTPGSLARARSQRIDVGRIIESLRRASQVDLPAPVIKALQRWAGKGSEARLERAIILRVKSPAILKSLQSSPKTRALIGEALGPLAVKVDEKNWHRLVTALAEMGLLTDIE